MAGLLDPRILSAMERLDLAARFVVDGFLSGRHKSPMHGYSVEFSQHRQYVHGDDVRHIDWKAYGKTGRYYLKQYHKETNLTATILLDTSASMAYRGEGLSKIDYAKLAAASLAFLVLDQRDRIALLHFAEKLTPVVAPTSNAGGFFDVCESVLQLPTGGESNVGAALHEAAGMLPRRGIVIVISDFLSNVDEIQKGLEHLAFEGHDCLALQVLAHDEVEFGFSGVVRFEALEGAGSIVTDAAQVRRAYKEALSGFLEHLRSATLAARSDYCLTATNESLDKALTAYLLARAEAS